MAQPAKKQVARQTIGDILLDMGAIEDKDLAVAVPLSKEKGQRLGEYLVAEGYINESTLGEALAQQFDSKYIELTDYEIGMEVAELVPYAFANQFNILPIAVDRDVVRIATFDPVGVFVLNVRKIQDQIKRPYEVFIISRTEFRGQLATIYADVQDQRESLGSVKPLVKMAGTVSVEKIVNNIIESAIDHNASDIHFEPEEELLRIRERIDGILKESQNIPLQHYPAIISRIKILGNLDIAEKRLPQDGRFRFDLGGKRIDFRISTLPTVLGEKVVLRILDKSNLKVNLTDLGLNSGMVQSIKKISRSPYGLFLISGPTGSGKTTSVYSILNFINTMEKNIITIEDPVEYQFKVINQVQVNTKVGLTFASILRNILRQDPDIIMVGEIRDKDTAEIAVRAALTGHLVISTLHTNDAVSAVSRLVDMGVDPVLFSSSLLGVLSQRLVRRLCTTCKFQVKKLEEGSLALKMELFEQGCNLFAPQGCNRCLGSGYTGREGLFELLIPDKNLRKAINRGASAQELGEIVFAKGFETMRNFGLEKVKEGHTTVEEILRVTV